MAKIAREIWAKLIADPNFQQLEGPVTTWIEESRSHRRNAAELLRIQSELITQILYFQDERRKYELDERQADNPSSIAVELKESIAYARRGVQIVRDIADGIAWRTLQYDRPAIRELARKPQTGALLPGVDTALAAAISHSKRTGDIVFINDLTNFVRFGDFTAVGGGGITITEVKSGRGSARSGKAKRQRKALDEKLDFLNTGTGVWADGSQARLIHCVTRARSHVPEVADLLRQSLETGCAYTRISDALAVEVVRPPVLVRLGHTEPAFHNPFKQSPRPYVYHTLKRFELWSANIAPVSIFPFDAQDCAAILTGAVWILSYCNLGNVIRCLRRRGLKASLPSSESLKSTVGLRPGEYIYHEFDAPLTVARPGGMVLGMSLASLARMFCEFLDEESFADQMEEAVDYIQQDPALLAGIGFANEADLWD